MPASDWLPSAGIEQLQSRARMLASIRAFFSERGVLEVETPVISRAGVTDLHIDSMQLANGRYLSSSPEFCMKRLLAAHGRDIYQVCKSFREGEAGQWHNPEFTMLEWYRVGFSLDALMEELAQLISRLSHDAISKVDRRSYAELFGTVTGVDPHTADIDDLIAVAERNDIDIPVGMAMAASQGLQCQIDRDEWLDWMMSCVVTSTLPSDRMTFVYDYPASQCALAKVVKAGEHQVARRFELYIGDRELANGYDELTDPVEQLARFERDIGRRQLLDKPVMDADDKLLQAMQHGMPECAGVAVGLDRLLAVISDQPRIDGEISFNWSKV